MSMIDSDSIQIECSDFYGNSPVVNPSTPITLSGYIDADPLFCDTAAGDYRISDTSPCAPANNACGVLMGKYGIGCSLPWLCGEANGDGIANISDIVFLVQYIFSGGPQPSPLVAADVQCSGVVNISDVVFMIAYVFSSGPAPCSGC